MNAIRTGRLGSDSSVIKEEVKRNIRLDFEGYFLFGFAASRRDNIC